MAEVAHAQAEEDEILYDVRGRVAVLTLNRPDKLNAWTGEMEKLARHYVEQADADENVRAIVITGAGRGFCAGADMAGLQKIEPGGERELESSRRPGDAAGQYSGYGPELSEHFKGRYAYMVQAKTPIIAAINGPCAGIGLVVTLFCDVRFASDAAKFTTAFAKRGLIAEHGISWMLPRLVGHANALDLLMSARKVDAHEAESVGLVNKTFPADSFMDEVMAYANDLAESVSPRSMAIMKAQVYKALFQNLVDATAIGDEEMQKSFASEDFKEGIAHFVEKRSPHFTGR